MKLIYICESSIFFTGFTMQQNALDLMLPENIIMGDLVNIDPDHVSNNHHDEKWL